MCKPFRKAADEDERLFRVMSGLLKPASTLTKRLSETQLTVHKRLTEKTRQCALQQSQLAGTKILEWLSVEFAQLVSVFIEAV
jgi:hypothetical protein